MSLVNKILLYMYYCFYFFRGGGGGGGAGWVVMVLGKLPVPCRPTYLDCSRARA